MSEKIDEYAGTPFAGFEPVSDDESGLFRSLIINTLLAPRFADWLVQLSFSNRTNNRSLFNKESLWNAFWMCTYELIEGRRSIERFKEVCVSREDGSTSRYICNENGDGLNRAVPFTICNGCRQSLRGKMEMILKDAVSAQRDKETPLKPEEIASIHKRLNGL